jgi:hypothetical protein
MHYFFKFILETKLRVSFPKQIWEISASGWFYYKEIIHLFKKITIETAQHNTTQHNTTQHNTTQHNTTQHSTKTQHNTT